MAGYDIIHNLPLQYVYPRKCMNPRMILKPAHVRPRPTAKSAKYPMKVNSPPVPPSPVVQKIEPIFVKISGIRLNADDMASIISVPMRNPPV